MSSPLSSVGNSPPPQSYASEIERSTKRHDLSPRIHSMEENSQTIRISQVSGVIGMWTAFQNLLLSAFINEVKHCSENLTSSLNFFISQHNYSSFLSIPWQELNDTQKNHFFSCLCNALGGYQSSSPTVKVLEGIFENQKNCLPSKMTENSMRSFHSHLPELSSYFILLMFEGFPKGSVCRKSIAETFNRSGELSDCIFRLNLPNHLLLADPFGFIKALTEGLPPQAPMLDIYKIYLFVLHFDRPEFLRLKIKCGEIFHKDQLPSEFSQLTAALGFRALLDKNFDTFYKMSGPLFYGEQKKEEILKSFPTLMENYVFLTYQASDQPFSFLISKQDLILIPFFEGLHNTNLQGGKEVDHVLCVEAKEDLSDYLLFFAYFFKRNINHLSLEQCLSLLRITDYYSCDKERIESLILSKIYQKNDLRIDEDMIVHLVAHMLYSSRLKKLLEENLWKKLSESKSLDNHLVQLKPFIQTFDRFNLYPITEPQFLSVAKYFGNDLETLNLRASDFNPNIFEKLREFRKLKHLTLLHLQDWPHPLSAIQNLSSLRSVKLVSGAKGLAPFRFTPLPWKILKIDSSNYNTSLMEALPQLENLTIELSNKQISAFIKDSTHLQGLVHLNIKSHYDLNTVELMKAFHRLPKLQSLTFNKNRMFTEVTCSPLDLASFVQNHSIRELDLPFSVQPELLALFPNLKTLNLVVSMFEIPVFIAAFEKLSSLESLSITLSDPRKQTKRSPEEDQQLQQLTDSQTFPDFDFSRLKNLRSFKFTSIADGLLLSKNTYISLSQIGPLENISLLNQPSSSSSMVDLIKKDHLKTLMLKDAVHPELREYATAHNIKLLRPTGFELSQKLWRM